jgi:hypothetical protein
VPTELSGSCAAGRDFIVRDLPWTVEKLRVIPPFEFENWAVIALGGIPNKVQVGDMGRRIFHVYENSPAIHGWVKRPTNQTSPVRDERNDLPSLTGLCHLGCVVPSHKWLGYCRRTI